MDGFLDSIADDRAREPEDPYPKQLGYLHTKAVSLYEEGIAIIEAFLDAFENDDFDTEQLKNGVVKMVMANDHFCLAFELVQARITVIQNNLNELGYSINDESERDLGRLRRVRPDLGTLPVKKSLSSTATAL